jgi:ubiquitin carboxyl-terminal hydrolase 8
MEHLPIPMERKSSNKTNVAEERMTTITTMDKSDKLVLPNVHNINQLSSDHKISATQTISQPKPYPPGLCGLINIGNTCFMNSALQCLSNIPQLTQWAQKQKPYSSTQTKDIIHVYTSLIQSMWSGENNTMNPRDIKEIVSHSAPIFTDYGQKDSHEFMNSLLNALERTHCASIITKLFHIHTQSQVTCRGCTSIDTTDETTTFLPLPLPRKTSYHEEILLENLINDYCLEDNLDGSYYCHSCTNYTQAKQKTNICSPLPHVLIIQLKRFPFDGTFQKLDTFVRYKLQYKNLISKNDIYQLCAVSSHVGSLANGHYTTLARNHLMKQWYLFNDNRIDKIKMDAVITSDAYVLVYLKSEEWDSSIS